jgi:hypothetical protein
MQAQKRASELKQKRLDRLRDRQIARTDASLGIKPEGPKEHTSILRPPPEEMEKDKEDKKRRGSGGEWTAGPWMSSGFNPFSSKSASSKK